MPSLLARAVSFYLRHFYKRSVGKGSIAEQRAGFEKLTRRGRNRPGAQVEGVDAGGVPAEWVTPPGAASGRVLFYLHGGWHYMGSPLVYRAFVHQLTREIGLRALVPDYRLAPEHPFPAGTDDAVAGYRWLLRQGIAPNQVVIAGDSAGGGLTLATLVRLRDERIPLPAAAVLISPWTDLALEGTSMTSKARIDPMFTAAHIRWAAEQYRGTADAKDPRVSPVHAALGGLPPLLIQVGGDELLLDDSTRVAERARAAGTSVTLTVWDGLFHDFQILPLPDARAALREIGAFARRHLERR